MHLSKRTNRRGGVVWFVRWRDGNKRYQKTLKGIESKDMAELAFAELRRQRELGRVDLPTDPDYTVDEALDDLLASKRVIVKDITKLEKRSDRIKKIVGGSEPVRKLTDRHVGDLRQRLQEDELAPSTINEYVGLLIAAAERAVLQKKIAHNPIPIEQVGRISDDREPAWRFLSRKEVSALLNVLENGYSVEQESRSGGKYQAHYKAPDGMKELVLFLLNTGARLGEALAVKWRDVNFDSEQVRLLTTKKASRGRKAVARHVPMNASLRGLLKRLKKEQKPSPDDPVLRINPHNLRRKFMNVCRRAGLGAVRLHDLRHTFCSHLAEANVPLSTIKALAGHETIAMTMRYAHLSDKALKQGTDALKFATPKKLNR